MVGGKDEKSLLSDSKVPAGTVWLTVYVLYGTWQGWEELVVWQQSTCRHCVTYSVCTVWYMARMRRDCCLTPKHLQVLCDLQCVYCMVDGKDEKSLLSDTKALAGTVWLTVYNWLIDYKELEMWVRVMRGENGEKWRVCVGELCLWLWRGHDKTTKDEEGTLGLRK